ncbi:DNA methyltransferase [Frateuria sp. GZRe14]|uniref:DNA methyltransferase n=1 Tax=Frateuria sp. GZRe14 TaxID=3351534 RepID=UPI003EDC303F
MIGVYRLCQHEYYSTMTWSLHRAVRARREQLNLSQTDLAASLGITKSALSHIENGNRPLTNEQVSSLATLLRMPTELLMLGSGRMPEDVRDIFDSDASAAVAAIRQFCEAEAVHYADVPSFVPIAGATPTISRASNAAIPERIDAQKTSTSYRAHSYHTKVPPEAITPFIRAFTRPGETIFDPFCGSGMTGVAALSEGRNGLLSDLSPSAVHIARNYTAPCSPDELSAGLFRVFTAVRSTMDWLYRPLNHDGFVEYTTWSDIFRCPTCAGPILYWDAVQASVTSDTDRILCTHCKVAHRKTELTWIGEQAVQSHTSSGTSNRINSHAMTRHELALIEDANAAPIPYWTPHIPFGPEREMWRGSHRAMGITTIEGFFTRRNLHALAALRHAIVCESTGRVREALMFAFTACVNRASKRYQWNAKRPTNVMTGTLYISSLRYEWNVWSLFRRKAEDALRYYTKFPSTGAKVDVFQRSAADLDCLPDRSIDMVFMDPPFGSNIFYADASLLWDSWLGRLTDENAEIVVNKSRKGSMGGKSLSDYGDLMQQAFSHTSRVLKPGGRAVLAFSNSDDKVWTAVQDALREAGFESASVHVLNKGQPSIKGVKGVTGKESVTTLDLLLCLKHTSKTSVSVATDVENGPPIGFVEQVIRDTVKASRCRTDEVYSAVIRASLAAHFSVAGITMPAIASKCRALGAREVDGHWQFEVNIIQEHDFVAGYLANPVDLPRSTGSETPASAPVARSVPGSRSSPFYQAHSYHTKVPPESIAPFIAHFTKPGDVILDPFCGSGMTGVAAAMSGRKAILNDLSPAAAHLAWNHTHAVDPDVLEKAFATIEARLLKVFETMYATRHPKGGAGYIHWTLWSTEHLCPECGKKFRLWDAMDQVTGRLGSLIQCPKCGDDIKRSRLESLGSIPVWIAYETKDGKRHEKAASAHDVKLALAHSRDTIDKWFPAVPIGQDREMYIRCALGRQGVASVADFYTPRNLKALSMLWNAIQEEPDDRTRRALAFAFTNTAWHGTRMRRFNARGGQRPLTGTLYIPQLSSEANVLEVMRNKIKQLRRYYESFKAAEGGNVYVQIGSATDLSQIESGSIDYVFTDPPFGSNLFYADCNLIWESWLGRLTNRTNEAVINRSLREENGGKTLRGYTDLMENAMKEIARVLKPGGWATVVFHNTDAEVWQSIRDASARAGFTFHQATSLDRKQQSHKGYKGKSGAEDVAHFDVIFNLRKPLDPEAPSSAHAKVNPPSREELFELVRSVVKSTKIAHGIQGVHAEVMRRLASLGSERFVDYGDVRTICEAFTHELKSKRKK